MLRKEVITVGRRTNMQARLDDFEDAAADVRKALKRLDNLVKITRSQMEAGCLREVTYDELKAA